MLNFEEWDKEYFVYVIPGNTRGELRIHPKTTYLNLNGKSRPIQAVYENCLSDGTVISFEKAFELAKSGMKFWASDDLGCYKIYFALQDALDRSLQEFPQLYVKFVETKPHLEAPAGADERLKKQYTICNVLFGYKEDYEKLSDEIKAHLESLRKVAENVLKGEIGKPLY